MNFWENVAEELNYKGMERKELGQRAGFPESYIAKGIARQSSPSVELATKIAEVLEVSVESLVLGKQPSTSLKSQEETKRLVQLYHKYHTIIETLEALPADKQQAAITIFEQCKILSRR
mgnify:CR=1 FL=1